MKKIKRAVTAEVKSTDDEKLLFRMDSKATKKVISFMTAVGLEYLEKALGTIIRKICEGIRAAHILMTRHTTLTVPATRSTAEL